LSFGWTVNDEDDLLEIVEQQAAIARMVELRR
jgi:hypothetical protein